MSILDGQSNQVVAAHFAVSRMSVLRHRQNHVPDIEDIPDTPRQIRDDLRELQDITRELLGGLSKTHPEAALRAVARCERQIALRIKVLSLPDSGRDQEKHTEQDIANLLDAVRPFPDAMAAVGKVIYRSLGITDEDLAADFPHASPGGSPQ